MLVKRLSVIVNWDIDITLSFGGHSFTVAWSIQQQTGAVQGVHAYKLNEYKENLTLVKTKFCLSTDYLQTSLRPLQPEGSETPLHILTPCQ